MENQRVFIAEHIEAKVFGYKFAPISFPYPRVEIDAISIPYEKLTQYSLDLIWHYRVTCAPDDLSQIKKELIVRIKHLLYSDLIEPLNLVRHALYARNVSEAVERLNELEALIRK